MINADPDTFKSLVQASLRRQMQVINILVSKGMKFWDDGNSFLLESSRAGTDIISCDDTTRFRYPSYIEDTMGDIELGPFRRICTRGSR